MIHDQLSIDSDGRYTLPCCGVRLKPPVVFPVRCNCRIPGLAAAIDECEQRGEETGDVVACGCPSSPKQPVFKCEIYGEAVRYASTKFKGQACIACEYIRNKITEG